ncbi:LytR C-terminal domain-containing protein [Streptomyces sp. LP05-1]|uniref:LytR C-terminal domain-containing protein n=1 Tax=Streptomyces pyxinae TaxID=2970734 RepID=A0ABT2CM13_9ACTN|nr:LCP family protein [Streptomyces sp. LP05-1]MCS0638132.1 LytR C-terminal domain-containing protein [Streptomyces sp. LP05-1]
MNDQQNPYGSYDPYDPYQQQPVIVGYDAYGRPVYQHPQQPQQTQAPQQAQQAQHPQQAQQPTEYDSYPAQPQVPRRHGHTGQHTGYPGYQEEYPYDPYGGAEAQRQGGAQEQGGRQQGYADHEPYQAQRAAHRAYGTGEAQRRQVGGYGQDPGHDHGQGYEHGYQDPGDRPGAQGHRREPEQEWEHEQRQERPEGQGRRGRRGRPAAVPRPRSGDERPGGPGAGEPGETREAQGEDPEYRTEQFSFIEEPDDGSEDVIDWLKFTESRSERREEAKRRGRNRVVVLAVALALALIGGAGWLWAAGLLPGSDSGTGSGAATATGPQQRSVIVLHLHNTKGDATSTALLVDNATTKRGTTLLLPNALAVADDDGSTTTLGKSVDDDGSSGTREAIGDLLGTRISGTWRLDTPYLENLVELVGGIELTTDTEVPGAKKGEAPLVPRGEDQTLSGRMAVAYATYRAPGEGEDKQLQRFGQVMYGVLRKVSDDPKNATVTVESLAQILDPSLPEKDLGASLAKLAAHAKLGDYKTDVLPVRADGSLSDEAGRSVVKDVLGGSVSAPEQGSAVRVGVKNATGTKDATQDARVVLVNGGYAFVDGGTADPASTSRVVYGDAAQKARAEEVAKTLGLPAETVTKGTAAANADVTVILGKDFRKG